MEAKIRVHLPHAFALVFEDWISAGTHFVALFAVFERTTTLPKGRVLLTFSPFEEVIDLSAESMSEFIADTLEEFEWPGNRCFFLCPTTES